MNNKNRRFLQGDPKSTIKITTFHSNPHNPAMSRHRRVFFFYPKKTLYI